jgi:hypothetical protein
MSILENKGLLKLVIKKGIKDKNPRVLWEEKLKQDILIASNIIHQTNLRGSGNYMIFGDHATNIINNYLNE